MRLSLPSIADRLGSHSPAPPALGQSTRQAAVAMVLREAQGATEALFILRAARQGDPWSGQVAFPGGHQDLDDASLRQTAERETLEEVGLDLPNACRYLGQLDAVKANPRGRNIDLVVTPFVYALGQADARLKANQEVAAILWGSLAAMFSGEIHDWHEFNVAGNRFEGPGYALEGQVVWGLTYRMLDKLFALLDPRWQPHDLPPSG